MHFITFLSLSFFFSLSLSLSLSLTHSVSLFLSFSFIIPTLAEYNYQHNQLLGHEPLLFTLASLASILLFLPPTPPPSDYVYYIYFQMDTICTTRNENGARRGRTEAVQIEQTWITTVLTQHIPVTGLFLLFRLYNMIFCDVKVILRRERCYMTVIASSLVRV